MKWTEVGFRYKSNGAFCTFFFFFLNFGLNCPFQPIRPIQADTARVGLIPRELARVRAASARVGLKKTNAKWHDVAGRAGSGVPCASPRPAALNAGTAPLVPRPCFTVVRLHCEK